MKTSTILSPNQSLEYNHDVVGPPSVCHGAFGFGIYKIEIDWGFKIDSILVDYDGRYAHGDNHISIKNDNNDPRVEWHQQDLTGINNFQTIVVPINPSNYFVKPWELLGLNRSFRTYDNNNFKYDNSNNNWFYYYLPLDSRLHSNHPLFLAQHHFYPSTVPIDNDERHGKFSLNLEVKKNISTPPYRTWAQFAHPTDVVIMAGVTFAIDKGNSGNLTTYTEYFITKYSDDNTGTNFIVQGPDDDFDGATLKLNNSNDYETNARMVFGELCQLTLENGSNFELGENSLIRFYQGGKFTNCGANISNSNGARMYVEDQSEFNVGTENCNSVEHTIDNAAFMVIEDGGVLKISDNSSLIVTGDNSFLRIEPGALVKMGTNSRIEVKNNAYLEADGITFEGNNGAIWDGLVFHNAGSQTRIENCTFKDAKISIDIKNTNGCYANLEKKITGNTFHQPATGTNLLRAENVFKLLLQANTFNIATNKIGVEIKNTINAGLPSFGEGQGIHCNTSYALNLLNNIFNNGGMQLYLNCWAAAVTPFMVQGNGFYNSSGLTSISIAGRKVSGDFKQNNFSSSSNSINTNVILLQSSVNMFNNQLQSTQLENLWSNLQSSFKMAPIYQNGQWIWYGGFNNLSSQRDNILVTNGSTLPTLDFGKNCFAIPTSQGQNKYHITGSGIQWNVAQHQTYYIRENSWNGWMGSNIPILNITNHQNQHIPYLHTPTISCPSTAWDGYTTVDIGFGIFDTVYYNNVGDLPEIAEDHELFNQAIYGYYNGDYLTSINSFKTLILGHPESSYTEACLYDMYDSYRALDTSSEQSYTDNLYSDLKNFLSAILLDESHSEDFNFTAYEIIQMCEVNMQKYNDALTGYEFIAMYHPDPEARFLASADHQEIMDMLGEGQGGMNLNAEEKLNRLEKKLNSFVKNDPVSQKLSKQYESQLNEKVINKSSRDSKELNSSEVSRMSRFEKEEKAYNVSQKEIINKANTLLLNGRSITKEERRNIVTEGILLMAGMVTGDETSENTIAPSSYSLYQNYPNPFNPETNISFSIPVEGLVKLKVFDITGREVAVLVNELKTPGSYKVSFNAATISSGVYFYRLEAGSFVETKRMLLLK